VSQDLTKVVMVDPISPEQLLFLRGIANAFQLDLSAPQNENTDDLNKLLVNAEAVIVQHRVFGAEFMRSAPQLKLIQKMGGRRDRIDVVTARQLGLVVALMTLPGSVAVAEHAFALILALAKNIIIAHQYTIEGAYRSLGIEPKVTSERSHGFQWMKMNDSIAELSGHSLGIIGFGDIGNEIAKRARAFDMKVMYYNRTRLEPDLEAELNVTYGSLSDILQQSDFVSLNTPLTPQTEKMIGMPELELMKPSAFLINTCRGGVIDEAALVEALRSKRIAGAGLDVFVEEPVPFDHPYLTLDNVVLTPHIGGGRGGARDRQPRAVFTNIRKFFNNQPIEYRVV
jgi:lactate dehydrogenase-like 2-hydroxyacid dehydrogenase